MNSIADSGPPRDFNPRPPRGGRPLAEESAAVSQISIHAPREGGDPKIAVTTSPRLVFQSTPPARGATTPPRQEIRPRYISIHAPREGGDKKQREEKKRQRHFNPRPPRGGRPKRSIRKQYNSKISIHAPREGGDLCFCAGVPSLVISIHAPREGGDFLVLHWPWLPNDFNPRPPRGGRPS